MIKALSAILPLAALAACADSAVPKISARDGWARETGAGGTAAVYVTIDNRGGADLLTGVRSGIGEAGLHESSFEKGIARMRPVAPGEGMVVPSNGKLALVPGGSHIMISGIGKPLRPGDRFRLTLTFARARPERVRVEVRRADAAPRPAA